MIRLSQRLQTIAKEVPAGSRLADIGSDHALLPSFLAQQGIIAGGVAGEVNEGPRDAAARQVRSAGLSGRIDVRLGDGLAVLSPGEVDVVTIAGMGGVLIASILEEGKSKLEGVKRLILQPNVGEGAVRQWLLDEGWVLIREQILEEDGKRYEVLTAVRSDEADRTNEEVYKPQVLREGLTADRELLLKLGPYLLQEASPVWSAKWRDELQKLEMIVSRLGQSELEASKEKQAEIRREIEVMEEVLAACTPKAKPSSH
ncbi:MULTISPECIES: tRNA (adenine(22)-N(1))-methyltransferase [Paenibacillus]|uniref:tRNA (adenine(22)-N(1))-methyltransferase n=1 Tax=Paenibacillus TaxID=44249 RepID=UPI0022B8EEF4|nr:class I SAM-dependent methyltransferase [Paenibacillus caseinilyticus]MCZ8518733.1 class I SAM-dependent methyltransferase [Paenibacillus caseinilyticus]